jgi:GT2 family glycosyltransferase
MPPLLHAIIISWEGYGEKARAIAQALDGSVDRLTVIYSNTAGTIENGPGTWVQVPQSWYYGRKFRATLDMVGPEEVMLQIQADAASEDWPALAAGCAACFNTRGDIGIWSPDIHWTPWPSQVVGRGMINGTNLLEVAQTDGIVWALHPALFPALRALDYSGNNLGWGIDWVALHDCIRQGKLAVRDLSYAVSHPDSRGYHNAEATQHMKNFLGQLPTADQREIMRLHADLETRKNALTPNYHAHIAPINHALPFSETPFMSQFFSAAHSAAQIAETFVVAGNVYVKAAGKNIEASVAVDVAGKQYPLQQMEQAPPLTHITQNFPLAAQSSTTAYQQLNDLDEWQVDGWHTLRVIPDFNARTQKIALGGALVIAPSDGPRVFLANLAQHRAMGDLVIRLDDSNGQFQHELRCTFNAAYNGGDEAAHYQPVEIALPQSNQTLHLSLSIDSHEAAGATPEAPSVFFIARPRLRAAGTTGMSVLMATATHAETPVQGAKWYHARIDTTPDGRAAQIALASGKERHTVMSVPQVSLTLRNDWGHVLDFHAEQTLPASVWLNGNPCFAVQLERGHNSLRFPVEYLTGQHTMLDIRDASGTVSLWRNWFLPRRQTTTIDTLMVETKGPYPSDLFPQSPQRFDALRKHLAHGTAPEMLPQISLAVDALEAGYDNLKRKPLAFPEVESPDVSVVIPAHNKVNVTYACLAALLLAWNKASFEVILVDDASTDETAQIEELVSGITVIHNEEAQRFIRACNAGAARARGKYVVLLNNDTEPTTGWLDALIDAFHRFPNVGLAGSKLLYPDGSLQDAGGIIWNSGDPWNYGSRQNPHDPRFTYARQADYLSGAAMMTTKAIWGELEGLSSYLEPMYFEDTDFAFKVRDAGYTTWYVPSSVVYHYEGMTSGTDTSKGYKRFQEINRPKFKRKWAKAFKNFSKTGTAPDLEKDRGIIGRVLFIDSTTPMPDQSAGSYAAIQEIKLVQSLGYKVTFMPENMAYMANYTHELERMGVEVITAPFYVSMNEFLDARGAEFDAFYITRYHVVNTTVPKIRAVNPQARIIMNNADLHYLRMLRKAIADHDETQKEAARLVQEQEFAAMRSVDVMLSYNDREQAVIEAQSEGAVNVMTCPWVLDCPDSVPPREGREGLSFLGGFQHQPNVEGVQWFAKNVMNRLEQSGSDLVLTLYGSRMKDDVKSLESQLVKPVGFIEDIADAYDKHLIFVAPLLSGAGIKGKVLSAIASGIPCILSTVAAEGIGLRDGRDCLIANTPEEWVAAIIRLSTDEKLWQTLSDNGHDLARTKFSFENGRNLMRAAFESADLFGQFE